MDVRSHAPSCARVPVLSRNTHEVMFRIVEMGVALWFPCVLWNCVQPEALWILNPRRILRRVKSRSDTVSDLKSLTDGKVPLTRADSLKVVAECWICYDAERQDAGPLIQPCLCRGDVSAVHHDCLKAWLVESNPNPDNVRCKVCNEGYSIQRGDVWLPAGLTISHWFQTAAIVSVMCSAAASSFLIVRLFDHMYVRTISVGSTILVEYICFRFLGFNLLSAYNRAKLSAIEIGGRLIQPHHALLAAASPGALAPAGESSRASEQEATVALPLSPTPSPSSPSTHTHSSSSSSASGASSSCLSTSYSSQESVVILCES